MKHCNRQTSTKTLADLYRALDRRHAVTITYLDKGDTKPQVRTIEVYDIRTTSRGLIEIRAMCRLRGEARRFMLDRIVSYTCHRIAYVLDVPEATTPAARPTIVRSAAQLIARELGRDDLPTRRITRDQTELAA